MDQSTFNHGKSGDTNPKGRSRSPLLELYTRSLRNEREEKIGHRTSAACGGRLRLCYTLDEGKESERETTNCPPKRVRSSYGYRPGRSPHHALRALRTQIRTGWVNHVFEADIRGYFNHVCHSWLQRMLRERIADPVILSLIGKWLRAGAMQDGVVVRSEEGTPQGGPISCILANIYLHFSLDLCFERKFNRQIQGEAYLVRFVDDFVVSFQYQADAEEFQRKLRERFARFNLELAEEKTRLLLFGRFATERRIRNGQKAETFEFLGFKHVCGVDRGGRFAVI